VLEENAPSRRARPHDRRPFPGAARSAAGGDAAGKPTRAAAARRRRRGRRTPPAPTPRRIRSGTRRAAPGSPARPGAAPRCLLVPSSSAAARFASVPRGFPRLPPRRLAARGRHSPGPETRAAPTPRSQRNRYACGSRGRSAVTQLDSVGRALGHRQGGRTDESARRGHAPRSRRRRRPRPKRASASPRERREANWRGGRPCLNTGRRRGFPGTGSAERRPAGGPLRRDPSGLIDRWEKGGGGEEKGRREKARALPPGAAERPHAHVQVGVRGQRPTRGARPCLNTGPPHATPNEPGSGIEPARREASPTRPRSATNRPGLPRAGENAVRKEDEATPPRPTTSGSPSSIAAGPAGDAPGHPTFGCRQTGPCPSRLSLPLSLAFALAAREPACLLPLSRLLRLFFAARLQNRLSPGQSCGMRSDGQTEATGPIERTDARESRRRRRRSPL